MRKYISRIGTACFLAIVSLGCIMIFKTNLADGTSVDAQTQNSNIQKTKQGAKLYPYYIDYPAELKLDGASLNYIILSTEKFKNEKEIPENKKDLRKYNIEMRQDKDSVFVSLIVKRNPGKDYVGSETEDGIDVTYVITKQNLNINRIMGK